MSLSACSELVNKDKPFTESMPDSSFTPEPEYKGPLNTIGQVGDAYIHNTGSLRRANNKLNALCIAAKVCEEEDEQ
jgi:hypothetical protein